MSVPMGQYPMAGDGNNGADPVMLFPNGGTVFVSPPPTYLVTANRIFVGGFPHDTTESELKKHFEQFFTVKEVKIIRKPTGESKGFGFVTFESEEQANYEVIKADPSRLQFRNRTLNIGPAIRKVETNTVGSSYMLVSSSGDICGTTQNPQLWQYGYPVMSPGIPCYPPKPADDSIKSPRFDPGKTPVTQQQFTFPPNGSYASIVSKGNQTPNGLKDTTNGNYTHKAPETPKQTVIPPTTNNYFLGQPDQYPPPSSPFAQKKPSGQNEVVPTNKNNKENVDVNGTPANENGPVYQQPMQPAHLPPHGYQQQAPVMFMPHMQQPMNGQQYPPMNYPQMQIPVPYYYGPKSYYHPGAPYQPMPFYLQPDPYRQNYGMAAYAGTDVHIDRSFQQQKNNARGDSNNNNNRYDRNRNNSNRSTPRNYTLEKQKSPSQISTPTRERKPLEPLKLSNEGPKGGSFNSSSATATEGFKKMSDSKGFSTDTQDENVIVEKLENVKIEENL